MQCGGMEIRNILLSAVPPTAGEQRKSWFLRCGRKLGVSASRARSIFYDHKCRLAVNEWARLQAMSGQLSKVRSLHEQLSSDQKGVRDELINEIRQLCHHILQAFGPMDQTGA